jgi:hypothetical protein
MCHCTAAVFSDETVHLHERCLGTAHIHVLDIIRKNIFFGIIDFFSVS